MSFGLFWRFIGQTWTQHYLESGEWASTPFPDKYLMTRWVNAFGDDQLAPVLVTEIAQITGLDPVQVQFLPLFTLPVIFSQGIIAYRLLGRETAFPIAILAAVSYRYFGVHLLTGAHRGAAGWALFMTLLALLLIQDRRRVYLLIAVGIMFPVAVHTLPVAVTPFVVAFGVLTTWSGSMTRQHRAVVAILIPVILVMIYDSLLFDWLPSVALKFVYATQISMPSNLHDIFFSSPTAPVLDPYLFRNSTSSLYARLLQFATAIIGCITATVYFHRLITLTSKRQGGDSWHPLNVLHRVKRRFTIYDAFIFAFAVQAPMLFFLIPFFGPSGGINPQIWGLFLAPVFVAYFVIEILEPRIKNRAPSVPTTNVAIVLLVAAIIVSPAFLSTVSAGTSQSNQLRAVQPDELSSLRWMADYHNTNQRVISDFAGLSAYHGVGGVNPSYLPPHGAPAYSEKRYAMNAIRSYYTHPGGAVDNASLYFVTEKMEEESILHVGSVQTKPNPRLSNQLSRDSRWGKVYVSDSVTIFSGANQSS